MLPDQGSLYTLREVLSALAFEVEQNPDVNSVQVHCQTVEKAVRSKFLEANPRLPLITVDSAVKKIGRDMDVVNLLDANKLSAKRRKLFLPKLDKIFDLVTCQCPIAVCEQDHDCSGAHVLCKCSKDSPKIPDIEAAWLRDQRLRDGNYKGEYVMKGIDWAEAKDQQRKADRIAAKERAEENRKAKEQTEVGDINFDDDTFDEINDDNNNDKEFVGKKDCTSALFYSRSRAVWVF